MEGEKGGNEGRRDREEEKGSINISRRDREG